MLTDAETSRAWRKKNPERARFLRTQWKQKNPHVARVGMWKQYGIKLTWDKYQHMCLLQKGLCAICRRPPGKKALAPDHNHTTGKIRGLLCSKCNCGIGNLNDDPVLLRLALEYLEQHQ